ncbi:hypothetical protein [Dokdonella sp.]|uniref:hypothetical protein n=1 Tax=Dokdonella sp. TaxID=2291710 RepID=UPI0025BD29AC|nr:hypothetical protein [Dokdonella sp.]MBX3688079.1 hypothetical protein [Dokdonella sp.]
MTIHTKVLRAHSIRRARTLTLGVASALLIALALPVGAQSAESKPQADSAHSTQTGTRIRKGELPPDRVLEVIVVAGAIKDSRLIARNDAADDRDIPLLPVAHERPQR